jgi:hypothetical protein
MSATTLSLTVEPGALDARSSWSEFESLAVAMSREVPLWVLEATLADAQERLIDLVCGPQWALVRSLPRRSHRYQVPALAARTITALLALRDHVIGTPPRRRPKPRMGRKPTHWTRVDRDYETLRINMHTLFHDLGITTTGAAAA